MRDLVIEEVNDIEEFRSLRESWNALLRESPDNNIFLTWEWQFTWWQYFDQGKELRIFLIKDGNELIGIIPFAQSKYRKGLISINILENLCSETCDYSGIIISRNKYETAFAFFMNYVEKMMRENEIIIRIWHVPRDSMFATALVQKYPSYSNSLFLYERIVSRCPYINLPTTWEEYYSDFLSKKKRKNLRRIMQTTKNHEVEFKKYTKTNDLRGQLQILFELHQKRWREKNIISKFTNPKAQEFYIDISRACLENDWLDLSFLNIDGKTVSVRWGFNYNNTRYCMTPAFDLNYSACAVGTQHLMKAIEESIQSGLKQFDFLKGEEPYKYDWTKSKKDNIRITITRNNIGGKFRVKLIEILPRIHFIGIRHIMRKLNVYRNRKQQK
jgi:CelD/BcsL family acetyltransferase involved in cellulose biosynthesis